MHPLQRISFSAETLAGTVISGQARSCADRLIGLAGDAVTFDGIFGAFFDGYWRRYTSILDLALTCSLTGHIEIEVTRVDSATDQSEQLVASVIKGDGEPLFIPVPLKAEGDTRLVLSVRFLTDAKLVDFAWSCSTEPTRAVALTVVICTFNRERDVAATLDRLLNERSGIARIIVVNHGEPGLACRLADKLFAVDGEQLTIIDQANLGGAGGFGRGMLEAIADDHCSHIVLMDDDIDLDAGVVARLAPLLSYLHTDLAIGGAMLDRRDRRTIFSIGDVLHPAKPEIINVVDPAANDSTSCTASRYLAEDHKIDFNGWWFFAVDKKDVAAFGLPLPLFIRGDDVEYGYRLVRSGTRTVGWPGLAIWHEPFYTKRHPWHYFYDRRNSLFLCEVHGRLGRWRLFWTLPVGFISHLLRFDYPRASCIALGLQAFNDGVDVLVQWNDSDHHRLSNAFSSNEIPAGDTERPESAAKSRWPAGLLLPARLVRDLTFPTRRRLETAPLIEADDWRPTIRHRSLQVRVYHSNSRSYSYNAHDRTQAWKCVLRFGREWIRFSLRKWKPARLISLTRPEFWVRYTT